VYLPWDACGKGGYLDAESGDDCHQSIRVGDASVAGP
jgi:hypothetical protein